MYCQNYVDQTMIGYQYNEGGKTMANKEQGKGKAKTNKPKLSKKDKKAKKADKRAKKESQGQSGV